MSDAIRCDGRLGRDGHISVFHGLAPVWVDCRNLEAARQVTNVTLRTARPPCQQTLNLDAINLRLSTCRQQHMHARGSGLARNEMVIHR